MIYCQRVIKGTKLLNNRITIVINDVWIFYVSSSFAYCCFDYLDERFYPITSGQYNAKSYNNFCIAKHKFRHCPTRESWEYQYSKHCSQFFLVIIIIVYFLSLETESLMNQLYFPNQGNEIKDKMLQNKGTLFVVHMRKMFA